MDLGHKSMKHVYLSYNFSEHFEFKHYQSDKAGYVISYTSPTRFIIGLI